MTQHSTKLSAGLPANAGNLAANGPGCSRLGNANFISVYYNTKNFKINMSSFFLLDVKTIAILTWLR